MLMCVTVQRNFADGMKIRTPDVVLLESVDSPLGDGCRAFLKDLGMNPLKVINSERSVSSIGMGTEFFPWIFRVMCTSN